MSFLLRLFRSEKPPDDETVLSSLARDIARRQTLLAALRARERTASTLVTLYALAAWLVYLGVWYLGFVSGGSAGRVRGVERAVRALPVFVGPIVILFIRRIVQVWYARKGDAEDKTLQTLLKSQRAKVEEIKKKTNFYETRELLSRYESGGSGDGSGSVSSPNTPQRGPRPSVLPPSSAAARQSHPLSHPTPSSSTTSFPPPHSSSAASHPQAHPSQPPPPSRRGWFDVLADVLVGPDDAALSAAETQAREEKQRWALVCAGCFAHCGLVGEGVWGGCNSPAPNAGTSTPPRAAAASPPRSDILSPTSPTSTSALARPRPHAPTQGQAQGRMQTQAQPQMQEARAGGEREGGTGREAQGAARRRSARGPGTGEEGEGEEEMEVDS
ncbi:hypothetical protein C8R47DRAFT_1172417 [Mycena vitilis]|nr:hypothetical protein C8R47DRAFT_1172417 [Mycena vitilis]